MANYHWTNFNGLRDRVRLYFGVGKSLHTGERTVLLYFFMINVMISRLNDDDSVLYIVSVNRHNDIKPNKGFVIFVLIFFLLPVKDFSLEIPEFE